METRQRRSSAEDVLRLDTDGNWFQGEYPILHDRTVQYLHKNVAIDSDGRYYLSGEDKPLYIQVEDVAYWISKVERTIAGFLITLTDGSIELMNPETLWTGKKNALYCLVKGGSIPAKFLRTPYYEITRDLRQRGKKSYLVVGSKNYPIQSSPPKSVILAKKRGAGRAATPKRPAKKGRGPKGKRAGPKTKKKFHARKVKKAAKKRR